MTNCGTEMAEVFACTVDAVLAIFWCCVDDVCRGPDLGLVLGRCCDASRGPDPGCVRGRGHGHGHGRGRGLCLCCGVGRCDHRLKSYQREKSGGVGDRCFDHWCGKRPR